MNKVISREYVEKNYIKKEEVIKIIDNVLTEITGEGDEAEYGARYLAKEIIDYFGGNKRCQ